MTVEATYEKRNTDIETKQKLLETMNRLTQLVRKFADSEKQDFIAELERELKETPTSDRALRDVGKHLGESHELVTQHVAQRAEAFRTGRLDDFKKLRGAAQKLIENVKKLDLLDPSPINDALLNMQQFFTDEDKDQVMTAFQERVHNAKVAAIGRGDADPFKTVRLFAEKFADSEKQDFIAELERELKETPASDRALRDVGKHLGESHELVTQHVAQRAEAFRTGELDDFKKLRGAAQKLIENVKKLDLLDPSPINDALLNMQQFFTDEDKDQVMTAFQERVHNAKVAAIGRGDADPFKTVRLFAKKFPDIMRLNMDYSDEEPNYKSKEQVQQLLVALTEIMSLVEALVSDPLFRKGYTFNQLQLSKDDRPSVMLHLRVQAQTKLFTDFGVMMIRVVVPIHKQVAIKTFGISLMTSEMERLVGHPLMNNQEITRFDLDLADPLHKKAFIDFLVTLSGRAGNNGDAQ